MTGSRLNAMAVLLLGILSAAGLAQDRGDQGPSHELNANQKSYHLGSIRLVTQANPGEFASQDTFVVALSSDADKVDRVFVRVRFVAGKGDKEIKELTCDVDVPKGTDYKRGTIVPCAPFNVPTSKVKDVDVALFTRVDAQRFEVATMKPNR